MVLLNIYRYKGIEVDFSKKEIYTFLTDTNLIEQEFQHIFYLNDQDNRRYPLYKIYTLGEFQPTLHTTYGWKINGKTELK